MRLGVSSLNLLAEYLPLSYPLTTKTSGGGGDGYTYCKLHISSIIVLWMADKNQWTDLAWSRKAGLFVSQDFYYCNIFLAFVIRYNNAAAKITKHHQLAVCDDPMFILFYIYREISEVGHRPYPGRLPAQPSSCDDWKTAYWDGLKSKSYINRLGIIYRRQNCSPCNRAGNWQFSTG